MVGDDGTVGGSVYVRVGGILQSYAILDAPNLVTLSYPVTFGAMTTFDVEVRMHADNETYTGMASIDYFTAPDAGVRLEQIEVLDAAGDPIPHAIIRGASGTQYLGSAPAPIVRVAKTGGGFLVGDSWATATDDLWWALELARLPGAVAKEIWVAAGTYKPVDSPAFAADDRHASFTIPNGTRVFGGFLGDEHLLSQRDPSVNETVLSGDILGDDLDDDFATNRGDNTYHIFRQVGGQPERLDGFTIRNGQAVNNVAHDTGGAMHIEGVHGFRVANCVFEQNSSLTWEAGALYLQQSTITIEDSIFRHNYSAHRAGAIRHRSGNTVLRGCLFEGNQAGNGGAIVGGQNFGGQSAGSIVVDDCTFIGNSAVGGGGAIGGFESTLFVSGSRFGLSGQEQGNSANTGGAIALTRGEIINCEFYGNTATIGANAAGGAISANSDNVVISGCLFQDNVAAHAGGAVFLAGSSVIRDSWFEDNQQTSTTGDGGAAIYASSALIERCNVRSNMASRFGAVRARTNAIAAGCVFDGNGGAGALVVENTTVSRCDFHNNSVGVRRLGGDFNIENSLFVGNDNGIIPWRGGADSHIVNCTIVGNDWGIRGLDSGTPAVNIHNCIIRQNHSGSFDSIVAGSDDVSVNYSNVEDGWSGPGSNNIDVDAQLIDTNGPDGVAYTGDENLRLGPGSPCINAGTSGLVSLSEVDLDSHARVLCEEVDMGAYEFGIGDENCDRIVDLSDFGEWSPCMAGPGNGLTSGCEVFDFNGDKDVDLDDFAEFAMNLASP